MTVEHHNLLVDFPGLRERIHELKMSNPKFAGLYREYDAVDKEIYRSKKRSRPLPISTPRT